MDMSWSQHGIIMSQKLRAVAQNSAHVLSALSTFSVFLDHLLYFISFAHVTYCNIHVFATFI